LGRDVSSPRPVTSSPLSLALVLRSLITPATSCSIGVSLRAADALVRLSALLTLSLRRSRRAYQHHAYRALFCAESLKLLHDLATVGGTAVVAGCISSCCASFLRRDSLRARVHQRRATRVLLGRCASLLMCSSRSLGNDSPERPVLLGVAVQGLGLDRCGRRRSLPALVELQLTRSWSAPLEAVLRQSSTQCFQTAPAEHSMLQGCVLWCVFSASPRCGTRRQRVSGCISRVQRCSYLSPAHALRLNRALAPAEALNASRLRFGPLPLQLCKLPAP
jgi:hypothetical protein